jgi:hypothetical protein
MAGLFKFAVAMGLAFALLAWITDRVRRNLPKLRNTLAFCLASGSAYSLSFALDLFVGAVAKIYPFSPLTVPVFTWTGIAIALYYLSQIAAISKWSVRLPYLLLGAFVAVVGFMASHPQHFYVAIPLLAIGLVASPKPISVATPF